MIIDDGQLQYQKNDEWKTGIQLDGQTVSVCFKPGSSEKTWRFKVALLAFVCTVR